MVAPQRTYAARLEIDYPDGLDRLTTFFRVFLIIPIAIVLSLVSAATSTTVVYKAGEVVERRRARRRHRRWLVRRHRADDFSGSDTRGGGSTSSWRSTASGRALAPTSALLTDRYPSTEDEQTVHLDLDYPDAREGLNQELPLVKWLLALPHYVVLLFLGLGAFFAVVIAWFAILFTGRYPRGLFDYVVGSPLGAAGAGLRVPPAHRRVSLQPPLTRARDWPREASKDKTGRPLPPTPPRSRGRRRGRGTSTRTATTGSGSRGTSRRRPRRGPP